MHLNDLELAEKYARECLELSSERDDTAEAAQLLITLALVASSRRDLAGTSQPGYQRASRSGGRVDDLGRRPVPDFLAELADAEGDVDAASGSSRRRWRSARRLAAPAYRLVALNSCRKLRTPGGRDKAPSGTSAHSPARRQPALHNWPRTALSELRLSPLGAERPSAPPACSEPPEETCVSRANHPWLAEGELYEEAVAGVRANLDESSLASLCGRRARQ